MPPDTAPEDIPGAGKNCFIAVPSAALFSGILKTVEEAVKRLQLLPLRVETDVFPFESNDFVRDIIDGIRSAKAVIAICSPESAGSPNPNVMYELGLAHAFDKPTLILTSARKKRPADLEGKHILKYNNSQVEKEHLILRIKDKLRERIANHRASSTIRPREQSDSSKPICPILFHPVGRENFHVILSFGKSNGTEIKLIETAHISILQTAINEALKNPNELSKVIAFDEYWSKYSNYFMETAIRVFDQLEDKFRKVDNSFSALLAMTEQVVDRRAKEHIRKSQAFYRIMKDGLLEYIQVHDDIRKGALPLLPHQDRMMEVYGQISKLSSITEKIRLQAEGLIANLIESILETGD